MAEHNKNLIGVFSASLFLLGGVVLGSASSSALTYSQDVGVNFTFSSTLQLTLSSNTLKIDNLAPGTASDSNIINLNVLTNSTNGYTLNATVGNSTTYNSRDLVHNDSNQSAKFASVDFGSSIASNTNLQDNTWAYSYSTDNGTNWEDYNGLPIYSDETNIATLKESTGPVADENGDNIKFKIAAKAANSQVAGTYNNVINFTLVATPIPTTLAMAYADANKTMFNGYYTMQDMNSNICDAVEVEGELLDVIDMRDYNVYSIAKIKGACWMTQNLRIIGTISAENSNFSTNDSFNPCIKDLTVGNSFDEPRCHDSLNTTNGVWYNYAAASAGTITGSSNANPTIEDICPAGWQLPQDGSSKGKTGSIAGNITGYAGAFLPVTGGVYRNGDISNANNGYWWSSTNYSDYGRYGLAYSDGWLAPDYSTRANGRYIRCVAK